MSISVLKKLGAATGILVLLWVAYLYRQVPRAQAPFAKADSQVQRIILTQGQRKVELQKVQLPTKGSVWKVSIGTGQVLAEESQITSLLSGLKDVQVEDEISDRADRAADYDVNAESGTRVQLFGAKEALLGDGLFGKQAPDYAHIYFRYPDKPNVYLARGLIRGELGNAEPNSWRSRDLIGIPEDKIQSIFIEGKGFQTKLIQLSSDTWAINGKTIDSGPVNALVGTLAHLRADDFIDPAAFPQITFEGLGDAHVTVNGKVSTVEMRIGAEDLKSKRYPVSTGKDNGLAWLNENSVKAILLKPSAFPAAKALKK